MRTPKVFLLGLALAGLAGCGTTAAAGSTPAWVAATAGASPPASPSGPRGEASGGPVSEPSGDPQDEAPDPSADPQVEVPDDSASDPSGGSASGPAQPDKDASGSKAKPPKQGGPRFGGPANSLVKTGQAGVALTFDDGPDPVQTPKLLDLLAEHGVKATFCLVGRNVVAHPELVRRIAADGHTLCNHTWQHSLTLGRQKPAAILSDLQRTNNAIRQAVPGAQIKYLRAPGGNFTKRFVAVAAGLGMTSIYWQVDPRDWDHPDGETDAAHVAKVVDAVRERVRKGAIVLSHDYQQPDTITAYEQLIPWLQDRFKLIALP